ncbi:MAG TPA: NAD(P)H-dependent oxidoreductase [Bauldia sp.]|nr:NAD(P)H-dependent oxidoreductase [Bauldia sp.]
MPSARILVFAGSIRTGALSGKLAAAAAKELALADADVTKISLADYPLPIYDGDLEATKGVPENATKLAQLIAASQGIFISTPEYNHSLPPLLVNAIAWVSRLQSTGTLPYRHKAYCLAGSSNGRYGGARAVIDLRKVISVALQGFVIPLRVELPMAQHAFNEAGELTDEGAMHSLKAAARQLVAYAPRIVD